MVEKFSILSPNAVMLLKRDNLRHNFSPEWQDLNIQSSCTETEFTHDGLSQASELD